MLQMFFLDHPVSLPWSFWFHFTWPDSNWPFLQFSLLLPSETPHSGSLLPRQLILLCQPCPALLVSSNKFLYFFPISLPPFAFIFGSLKLFLRGHVSNGAFLAFIICSNCLLLEKLFSISGALHLSGFFLPFLSICCFSSTSWALNADVEVTKGVIKGKKVIGVSGHWRNHKCMMEWLGKLVFVAWNKMSA